MIKEQRKKNGRSENIMSMSSRKQWPILDAGLQTKKATAWKSQTPMAPVSGDKSMTRVRAKP